MKYTEKGITFVNVKLPNIIIPDAIGRQDRLTIDGDNVSNIDNEKTLINAIDIDWNGAQLDNDLINTTADLLNYIKNKTSGSGGGSSLSNIPSYTTSCYRWYMEGHTPQSIIAKPSGNLIDIFNPDANLSDRIYCIPENYWSKNAPNRPQGDYILWLSLAEVRLINGVWTIESWSDPFLISGINGTAGEDLSDREFIYKLFITKHDWSTDNSNLNPEVWPATDDSDYAGPLIDGVRAWKDNPEGVDDTNRYEYESQRTFKNGHWTKFCRPYLRSCFGRNGMDGDGVEYVYIRTEGNTQPIVSQNQDSILLEQLSDEYLPYVDYVDENSLTHHERCTDDPAGINSTYKYEWVLKRRKTSPDSVTGERLWLAYSGQMALWAKYSEEGDKVEVKNGLLYINGEPQNITVEGQGGGGTAVGNITLLDIINNTNNNNYILGRYNGQLYVWTGSSWVSLGESNGNGAYGHIAYADSVTTSVVNGKTVVTSISGFTVDSGNTSKKWIGIYIDDNDSDPGSDLGQPYTNTNITNDSQIQIELSKYKWQYVAGKDGNGFEFIYCLTKSGVIPGIDESDGITEGTNGYTSGNKLNSEFYPKITVQNGVVSLQVSTSLPTLNDKYYWSDDPVGDVNSTYTTLWWANRKFVNGEWTSFRGPNKIDEWKENSIAESSIPFYKWSNTVPSAPSIPTSVLNFRTIAHNEGWSDSSSIPSPYPSDSSYKFYSCIATLRNGVFYQWGPVEEVSSPNVQVVNGKSPFQLICYPSAINIRATSVGDFIDNIYKINCSVVQGDSIITSSSLTAGGYHIYYRKTYTNVEDAWNSPTSNNDLYQTSFLTDFGGTVTDGGTTYSCIEATGISQITDKGYLKAIEFCLSSANSGNTVLASNTLASITVPITCDGQKGASGSSVGNDGYTREIIKLYKKSILDLTDTDPSLTYKKTPKDNIYFDFSTNKLYLKDSQSDTYTITSEFSDKSYEENFYYNKDDCPGDGELYVITALAFTRDINTKVEIKPDQWSAPSLYTDSLNTAIISLYKRNSTNLVGTNLNLALGTGQYEYNFSLKKLSKYDSNTTTYISDLSNSIWNGWHTYVPNGTDPCYITLATACSSNNIDYIKISEFSSISLYVKNGQNGENGINGQDGAKGDTGKMFFSMGVWNENTKYILDTLKIPMVFYDNGEWNEALGCYGSYYYLNPEYTNPLGVLGINTKPTGSQSKFDNNTKDIWIKATNYGLVMTQGIFAEFAKFGSAIISGDYMFSTLGTYGGEMRYNSVTKDDEPYDSALYKLGYNNSVSQNTNIPISNGGRFPLYMFFDYANPYNIIIDNQIFTDVVIPCDGSITLEDIINWNNSGNRKIFKLKHNQYIKISIKYKSTCNNEGTDIDVSGGNINYSTLYMSENNKLTPQVLLYNIHNNSNWIQFTSSNIGSNSDSEQLFYITEKYTYVGGKSKHSDLQLYFSADSEYSDNNGDTSYALKCDIKVEVIEKYFNPNWAVDLKSGEMIAGLGKFKVDALGNVSIKGNIESGSDITGATITGGIIKADNFYRNVWVSGEPKYKWVYCSLKPTKLEEMLFEFLDLTYYNNRSTYTFVFEQNKYYNIYYPSDTNLNRRMYDSSNSDSSLLFWYNYCNWHITYIPPLGSRYPFGTYDERLDENSSLYDPSLVYDPESDDNFDFNNSEWRYFTDLGNGNGWSLDSNTNISNTNIYSKVKNYGTDNVVTYEVLAYEDNNKPYFLLCTGNSDLIIVSDNAPYNDQDTDIILPRPQDFPNKVIEILDLRYVNSESLGKLELKSIGSGVDGSRDAHFSLSFTGGNNKQSLRLNGNNDTTGRNYSFISYEVSDGLNGTRYCWVKMNSNY